METPEQTKELLLGYLLNALNDGEAAQVKRELERNPQLRAELAALQREVAPLDHLGDSVEPPPMLASRTCAKIWNTLDSEESGYTPNSGTFLDSAYFSPEAVLPAFLLATSSETKEEKEEIPREIKKPKMTEELPPRSSPWIGLVASISVGIVVAFVLFPMINYIKRSTRSHIADTWMHEITRRADQYEQIHGGNASKVEEEKPYNLALSGWQEINAEVFDNRTLDEFNAFIAGGLPRESITDSGTRRIESPQEMLAEMLEKHISSETLAPSGGDIYSAEPPDWQSGNILLVVPGQAIPLRSAFGQDFLFKDGRVFSRTLPTTSP